MLLFHIRHHWNSLERPGAYQAWLYGPEGEGQEHRGPGGFLLNPTGEGLEEEWADQGSAWKNSRINILETKVIKESWLIFKDYLLQVQEWSVWHAGMQEKVAGRLHGWTRNSWLNSNIKMKHTRGRGRVKQLRRNTQTLSKSTGMRLGNQQHEVQLEASRYPGVDTGANTV